MKRVGKNTDIRQKGSRLGFLTGILLAIFGGKSEKAADASVENLRRSEFKTSTQALGIRFTGKIRGVFRHRWLRRG